MPIGNGETIYWLATSVDVFATDTLIHNNTQWIHQAEQSVGYTVTDMIHSRSSDGLVIAGTHGEGVFSAKLNNIGQIQTTQNNQAVNTHIFPNPFTDQIHIEQTAYSPSAKNNLRIYDMKGRLLLEQKFTGTKTTIFTGSLELDPGVYLMALNVNGTRNVKKIIKR